MRKVAVLAAAIAIWGLGAAAAQAQVRGNDYGMAGCGLGSLVFQNDPDRVKQILAATTNGTFGSQTFGITTGTSNCNPQGPAKSAALFVEVNREALAKDISRGGGETIDNLSAIMGCSDPRAVGAVLQQNFRTIFPNQAVSSGRVTDAIFETIKQDRALAGGCSSLG